MNRLVVASAALLCAGVGSGFAKDYGNGFSADGYVSLNYRSSSSGDYGYLVGDATLAYTYNSFGFEVSLLGEAHENDSFHALTGGVTYTFGNGGKVIVGAPSSAYDQHGGNSLSGIFADYNVRFLGGKIGFLTNGALSDFTTDDYGIRYDSAVGEALSYSASVHRVKEFDFTIIAASGSFETNGFVIEGGYENSTAPGGFEARFAKLSVAKTFGQLTGKLYTSDFNLFGSKLQYSEISASYQVTDSLVIGGLLGKISAAPDPWYGVSAAYEFLPGASAHLGVIAFQGGDPSFELGVKYTF